MTPRAFMEAVERRRLIEREASLCITPGRRLPGAHLDGKGPGGDMRSPAAVAAREKELKKRGERASAMRAQGLMWTEIGRRMALSPRMVRFAVTGFRP